MSAAPLSQPPRDVPSLPRSWVHRYHQIRVTRGSDGTTLTVPCTAANFFIMDLNPRWYVDGLMRTHGDTMFILYLDTANACTDKCTMCFTSDTRNREGLRQKLNVDLALSRISILRDRYDTFQMVSMAGPGEPLSLPRLPELLRGCQANGLITRVYTAGKRLSAPNIRAALVDTTALVRVSIDAATEDTYRATHGVTGLADRLRSISRLVTHRDATDSDLLIGLHFVIQNTNADEILPFAAMARDLGADFVVYGQETFAKVAGGLTEAAYGRIVRQLAEVEALHNERFAVVVPRLVRRPTIVNYHKDRYMSVQRLDECYNSKNRVFFGVQNDFSACWLATMDARFREESFVGDLHDPEIIQRIAEVVERGVGSGLGRGAFLSCDSCVANNYNSMIEAILTHLQGEAAWDVRLVPYVPGEHVDPAYKMAFDGELGAIRTRSGSGGAPNVVRVELTSRRGVPVV